MAKSPPLLPAEILRRVIRVARFHGLSIVIFTGAFTLGTAAFGDFKSALVCLAITAAGFLELRGAKLLAAGQPRGLDWLVRSHLYLLTVILIYIAWQLLTYSPAQARHLLAPAMQSAGMQDQLDAIGASPEDVSQMMSMIYYAGYGIFAVVSILYSGAFALYYHGKRATVAAALGPKMP
jgi:hypothetical protein